MHAAQQMRRASPQRKRALRRAGKFSRAAFCAFRVWAIAYIATSIVIVSLYSVWPPRGGVLILSETWRLGGAAQQWRPLAEISPHLRRAVMAAEDAKFCDHWGVDAAAFSGAASAYLRGAARPSGGSSISQQTVKNVFFGPSRSILRKSAELWYTMLAEVIWGKRHILEAYLNVAEFGEGVFGAEAAAQKYFGKPASKLNWDEAARLATVLPSPRRRDPRKLSEALTRKRDLTAQGAEDLRLTGRAACVAS